jgi:hypothetical protein
MLCDGKQWHCIRIIAREALARMADGSLATLWRRAALLLALLLASWLAPRAWMRDESCGVSPHSDCPDCLRRVASGLGSSRGANGLRRPPARGTTTARPAATATPHGDAADGSGQPLQPRRIDTRVFVVAARPANFVPTQPAAPDRSATGSQAPLRPAIPAEPATSALATAASAAPDDDDADTTPDAAIGRDENVPSAVPASGRAGQPPETLRPAVSRLVEYLEPLAFSSATRGWVAATLPHVERLPDPTLLAAQPQHFAQAGARLRQSADALQAIEPRLDEPAAVAARRAQHALRRYADVIEAVARWQMVRTSVAQRRTLGTADRERGVASLGADTILTAHLPPHDPQSLLEAWEAFEAAPSPQAARGLATHLQRLSAAGAGAAGAAPTAAAAAGAPPHATLAEGPRADHRVAEARLRSILEQHTRGANVRIVVSQELLGRLLPPIPEQREPVCECILGYDVQGSSRRQTRLDVRFAPHPLRGAGAGYIELMASGTVEADTWSRSGWVKTFTRSDATFHVRQPLELDPRGLRISGAPHVQVQSRTQLRDVQSDMDALPVLGPVVRALAAEQYQQMRGQADAEARRKLEARILQQFQEEAPRAVERINEQLTTHVLQPLRELGLEPRDVWFEAAESRLAIRVRLAADEQLAAHTPRPRALADSVASFQVHQSAVNNLVERLELAGGTFTPDQLRQHLLRRWPALPQLAAADTGNDGPADGGDNARGVLVTFAADPVSIRCESGRVRVELNLEQLCADGERWTDITVQVYYRPQWRGAAVELVRDGPVHLVRGGTTFRSQLALRGIFSRVFHKDRGIIVGPRPEETDQRWAGLAVTQFVLDDGWLGVALGPLHEAPLVLGRGNDRHVELRR